MNMTIRAICSTICLCMATACLAAAAQTTRPAHRSGPYILGADISWTDEDQANGTTYYDHGRRGDILQILKSHGFNFIRLRVFVNPAAPGGYAATSNDAFCDMVHTAAMAKRARAVGMGLLIDFHYSDNWADPGKQTKPAAWKDFDFEGLRKAVYDHTHAVLSALKQQGTTPEMVQIGNEVTNGMLWPDGRAKDHFDQFALLLKSGIAAARDVDPAIKIVLHNDRGRNVEGVRPWLDGLIAHGVSDFDIVGLSCNDTGSPDNWKRSFDELARDYPQYGLIAAEYGYHKRELNDAVFNAPGNRGLGSFIWEPTRHHEALFDHDGVNAGAGTQRPPGTSAPASGPRHRPRSGRYDTNALIDLYPRMASDYGNAK